MVQGRRKARCSCAAAAGVALFAASTPVHAAKLAWSSPRDCERADVVEARIEELTGRDFALVEQPNFDVSVVHGGEDWQLTLVTETAEDTSRRELRGRSCGEVTDAAAVAMAMAIRAAVPDAVESDPPTSAAAEPAKAAMAPPAGASSAKGEAKDKPQPSQSSKSAARLRGSVGIAAVLDTAALPGPAPGVELRGAARWGWLRAELQGAAFAPSTATLADGRSGTFSLLSGALLGCIEPSATTVGVFGCAGFELGRLAGEGHGVSNPEVGTALWSAARLELGAGLNVNSSLKLDARVGVAAPFSRKQFVLDGEPVHEPAALSVRAALGIDFLW
ncbi:MAG TPA: hypothetical protein VLJ38_18245 [Polyangiaceae bacterium]|nr:hypothetical protein [Polyangiaceae bacterium]